MACFMDLGYRLRFFAVKLFSGWGFTEQTGKYRSMTDCSILQYDDHKLSGVKLWDIIDCQSTCDKYDKIPS